MIVTASQFWQKLESTGLASAEECRQFAAEMAEEVPADQMLETDSVAAWLLSKKVITPYQAKVLMGQRKGPLACGSYTVHAEVNDPVLRSWYRATHQSGAGEYWLFAMPEDLLQRDELLANPPSLQLAQAHAAIEDSLLCMLSVPQFSDGYLCFASSIADGRSLLSTMQGVAMPAATAKQIVIQVAIALDRIHQAGLVHGDIGMHSVWWDGDQTIRLIRDPLFLPSNPLADVHRLSTIQVDQVQRWRYAAPEFTVPGQRPTISTDLYAIGCLWFELLSGQPLIQETEPNAITKATLTASAKDRKVAVLPPPAQRVLNHLLAPNPTHRFASVLQFMTALQALSSTPQNLSTPEAPQERSSTAKASNGNGSLTALGSEPSDKNNPKRQAWKQEATAPTPATPAGPKPNSASVSASNGAPAGQKQSVPAQEKPTPKPTLAKDASAKEAPTPESRPSQSAPANQKPTAPAVPSAKAATTEKKPEPSKTAATNPVSEPIKKATPQPAAAPATTQAATKQPATPVQNVAPKSVPKPAGTTNSPRATPKPQAKPAPAVTSPVLEKKEPLESVLEVAKKQEPQVADKPASVQNPVAQKPIDVQRKTEPLKPDAPKSNTPITTAQSTSPKADVAMPAPQATPTTQAVATQAATANQVNPAVEETKEPAKQTAAEKSEEFSLPFEDLAKSTSAASSKPAPKADVAFGLDTSMFDVASRPTIAPKKRVPKAPAWYLPTAVGVGVLLIIVVMYFLLSGKKTTRKEQPPAVPAETPKQLPAESAQSTDAATTTSSTSADPIAQKFDLVEDDKSTLWSPPYVSDPIKLDLLPPGTQGVVYLNLQKILDNAPYQELDAVVHPAYQSLAQLVSDQLPLPLDQWKTVVVGLYPNESTQLPDVVVRGELREAKPIEEVTKKFAFTTPLEDIAFEDKKYKTNAAGETSIVIPLDSPEQTTAKTVSIGPTKLIKEWVELEGAIVPLTRQLETLRIASSSENDITFLANASLLLASGRGMVKESLQGLEPFIQKYMQEDVSAISIATNIDDDWYTEVRVMGKDAQLAPKIMDDLKSILAEVPDDAEATLVNQMADPYWNKVALRLPQQLRTLQQQSRVGIENGHALANFYLPNKAASNLVFSTWMAMRSPLQPKTNTVVSEAPTQTALTIDEALKTPMTIKFDQESLESGANEVQTAFSDATKNPASAIQIVINGSALEKDGITRNQQIRGFSHENKPLREVLISLVRKANPVTTVQNPNEKDQKLIWVVKDADTRTIEITTRNDAAANKKQIPDEFVLAQ